MWHFGRQNLGIVSFATRIGQHRPMDRFERWTLTAGMLAGVLGGYRIFAPALLLNPHAWPLDLGVIDPLLSQLWYAGIAIYAVLIPVTIAGVISRRHLYTPLTLAVYLGCVFFFLPTYLSTNGLFLIMGWSVAHGIQYLVVLAFHAMGRVGRPSGWTALAPLGLFGLCLAAGVAIWQSSLYVQDRGDETLIKLLVATTVSLTWAHYWIDQFLWRFGTPERRAWLAQSFPFLAPAQARAKVLA
jgi:Na+/H+-dicarboxylate symporter